MCDEIEEDVLKKSGVEEGREECSRQRGYCAVVALQS